MSSTCTETRLAMSMRSYIYVIVELTSIYIGLRPHILTLMPFSVIYHASIYSFVNVVQLLAIYIAVTYMQYNQLAYNFAKISITCVTVVLYWYSQTATGL